MRKINFIILMTVIALAGSGCKHLTPKDPNNPFFAAYQTPFEVPPFDKIKNEHFMPAFQVGMEEHKAEIDSIIENSAEPDFENTIVAYDKSGQLLSRVGAVFYNLNEANTNKTLQAIAKELAPKMSKHDDDIKLNAKLFERIKKVYDKKDKLSLNTEQSRLLEKVYKEFVRGGANLPADKQTRLRQINEEISSLGVKFSENILAENADFKLVIDKKEDLQGLPEGAITSAAEAAKEKGLAGKWVFTLSKPSMIPFLQYAQKRDLREKLYQGYLNRGNNGNKHDNKEVIVKMADLRVEKAQLLGFKTFSDFELDVNMAKTPDKVYELLHRVWKPALEVAKKELAEMQALAEKEGATFKLESWDWWFYSEKVRKDKYDLDEEMLRPYFKLENVRNGVFYTAERLYGLQFTQRKDIPAYHPDCEIFEVKDKDGKHLGILYMDYFPRDSKKGGAWCTSFREQTINKGKFITPVVSVVCNFSKPAGNQPALLNYDEVNTLFHEFGHSLHSLFQQCSYYKTINTPRDFVELPSQVNENWSLEPEVLKVYAKHYQTGETIPQALLDKLSKSSKFNQGFATVEYLAAAILDMDFHTISKPEKLDIAKFEKESMDRIGLIKEIAPRYRSTYFSHIWDGGYSSGYYSYIWAEVLDADAFQAFKEKGNIFDPETAKAFREKLLSKGGSDDAMTLYRNFRGADPKIDPLLKRRGFE